MLVIITKKGIIKKLDESLIRSMGRESKGVIGIKVNLDDEVAGIVALPASTNLEGK